MGSHLANTSIIQALPDAVLVIRRDGTILDSLGGRSFCLDLGPDLIVDRNIDDVLPPEAAQVIRSGIAKVLKTREPHCRTVSIDKQRFELRMSPHGRDRILTVLRDVSDSDGSEEIRALTRRDAVTGLVSREIFLTYFETAVADALLAERGLAVLYLSLDQFRSVRDSVDQHFGDDLLRVIAERLLGCLREADHILTIPGVSDALAAARIGDGEFAILLNNIEQRDDAQAAVQRILGEFAAPVSLQDHEFLLKPCMGLAVCPHDGKDAKSLLQNAMTAMYEARKLDRSSVEFYSDTIKVRSLKRLDLEKELHWALEQNQLRLNYQPVFDLAAAAPVSMEAFLRWDHPLKGTLRPGEFLPLAEATGFIMQISDWVLEKALSDTAHLHATTGTQMRVSVNLARQYFARPDLCDVMFDTLEKHNLDPSFLQLDLTERMLMRADDAGPVLSILKSMGIGLQIDDFGSGFSSLKRLKMMPVDALKIDGDFIDGIGQSSESEAICSSVIGLAHAYGLRCVAEAVETSAQVQFLRANGCDEVQGNALSPELDLASLCEFVSGFAEERADAALYA